METGFRSTFRSFLKASVACGALTTVLHGPAVAAERDMASPSYVAAAAIVDESSPGAAVDEVVVTGTNIRGVRAISPVSQVSREEFERNGYVDIGQALRSLPGNFGGGINPETAGQDTAASGGANGTNAASANLHGLGSGATLTLLNGHRLPVVGEGNAVDLSLIPIAAIERVDVLANGASAIYGADAVAGVVNVITRRKYDGLETRLRYGGAEGGLETYAASVLGGGTIGPVTGIVGAEYLNRGRLGTQKRAASRNLALPDSLVGEQERTSYFASGDADIASNVKVFFDGLYMQRFDTAETGGLQPNMVNIKVHQYVANAGADVRFGDGWLIEFSGNTNSNTSKTPAITRNISGNFVRSTLTVRTNELKSLDARLTGPILQLPGGALEVAAGASYRDERLTSQTGRPGAGRHVSSVYAELDVPIIGAANHRSGFDELRFNISGRYDNYSDVGDIVVPKVELLWKPIAEVAINAGYSESFRAPSMSDSASLYYVNGLPPESTPLNVLYVSGTGHPLKPENSKNYNLGIRYEPLWLPGLVISVDAIRIKYTGRIGAPDPSYAYAYDPSKAPAQFVETNPSQARIDELVRGASSPLAAFPFSATQLIVDVRNTNIASTTFEGLQASSHYHAPFAAGALELGFDVSYISKLTDVVLPGTPAVNRAGTFFSPPKYRARTSAQWSTPSWAIAGTWNYTDNYLDNRNPGALRKVSAWNTFDASVTYRLGNSFPVAGTRVILSATNLFDEGPPRTVVTRSYEPAYDPTNASATGRFVSLEVVKQW